MRRAVRALVAAGLMLAIALPAAAQHSMHGMDMKGMVAPKPASAKKKPPPAARKAPAKRSATALAPERKSATRRINGAAMSGMDRSGGEISVSAESGLADMPGMATPAAPASGTALPVGAAPAPPPPTDRYADRFFVPEDMHRAHRAMMTEGQHPLATLLFNLAEYQIRDGKDGYRWDGEGWFGGDIDRLVVKTEGEGTVREGVDTAEIQALYSRAVGPYFNLQAGVRHDFRPSPSRTYATIGFEGLAPYWFEVEGAAFVSDKGDVLARLEGYYDQRITQRLILQPRVELNLSAQDVPENRLGAGLTNAELGLRLRYEITREFAPYIGLSYDAKVGHTADYARAESKDPISTSLVAGLRFWF